MPGTVEDASPFVSELQRFLISRGLSWRRLAALTGYHPSWLSKVKHGAPPSADLVRRCDEVLEADGALVALAAVQGPPSPAQLPASPAGFVDRRLERRLRWAGEGHGRGHRRPSNRLLLTRRAAKHSPICAIATATPPAHACQVTRSNVAPTRHEHPCQVRQPPCALTAMDLADAARPAARRESVPVRRSHRHGPIEPRATQMDPRAEDIVAGAARSVSTPQSRGKS
jgi:hypothetical protein